MRKLVLIALLALIAMPLVAGCSKEDATAQQPATQEQKSQTPSPQGTTEADDSTTVRGAGLCRPAPRRVLGEP